MRARLQVSPRGAEPFELEIGNTASIGRTDDNTVCLHSDPSVSRHHALIRAQADGRYYLTDLGSRNGTYLNDQRVVFPVALDFGASVRVADTVITLMPSEWPMPRDDPGRTVFTPQTAAPASGATHSVAVLVCDIRGFSERAERLAVDEIAPLLGDWFRGAGKCVERAGGIVDKFIGDAMLAYWGTGQGQPDCGAALSVSWQLLQLAAARCWPGGPPIEIVVALHFGPVMLSNVGLHGERDATIIGDAVNVAFRLEGIAKAAGQRIVLSEDFRATFAAPLALHDLGKQSLKGRTQPVRVFGWN